MKQLEQSMHVHVHIVLGRISDGGKGKKIGILSRRLSLSGISANLPFFSFFFLLDSQVMYVTNYLCRVSPSLGRKVHKFFCLNLLL